MLRVAALHVLHSVCDLERDPCGLLEEGQQSLANVAHTTVVYPGDGLDEKLNGQQRLSKDRAADETLGQLRQPLFARLQGGSGATSGEKRVLERRNGPQVPCQAVAVAAGAGVVCHLLLRVSMVPDGVETTTSFFWRFVVREQHTELVGHRVRIVVCCRPFIA